MSKGSEAVKRARLKISWLSAFRGSNPLPCIYMKPISNLDRLLKEMGPVLIGRNFVFCSISEEKFSKLGFNPTMSFKEKEGITIITEKERADKNLLNYQGEWAMITLTVNSDLHAVGFLAKIIGALANKNISVNAVSAFYHDHLFVSSERSEEAMEILNSLSK